MVSPAFETAILRAGLREAPAPVGTAPTASDVGRVLLHESPEGALTWHLPDARPTLAAVPGRVRTFDFDLVDRVVETFERRHRPHRLRRFGPDGTPDAPVDHDAATRKMTDASGANLPGAVVENNNNIMSVGGEVQAQHYSTFHEALRAVTGIEEWALGPKQARPAPGGP